MIWGIWTNASAWTLRLASTPVRTLCHAFSISARKARVSRTTAENMTMLDKMLVDDITVYGWQRRGTHATASGGRMCS